MSSPWGRKEAGSCEVPAPIRVSQHLNTLLLLLARLPPAFSAFSSLLSFCVNRICLLPPTIHQDCISDLWPLLENFIGHLWSVYSSLPCWLPLSSWLFDTFSSLGFSDDVFFLFLFTSWDTTSLVCPLNTGCSHVPSSTHFPSYSWNILLQWPLPSQHFTTTNIRMTSKQLFLSRAKIPATFPLGCFRTSRVTVSSTGEWLGEKEHAFVTIPMLWP